MTTPDMKPGLNFGGGSGRGPNPFRITFFIVGVVFLIIGLSGNSVFLGSGIVFVILSFVLQDGDGKGPGSGAGRERHPKDDDGWSREQMDQSDAEGDPRPKFGSEDS